MKQNNATPRSLDGLISLGVKVLAGAESIGAEIDLGQNTPPKIAADLYDLAGNPATPLVPGKQAAYAAQKTVLSDAYAAGRAAILAGRDYCRLAINILKASLGNRWNSQWNAAGFIAPTLALPNDPVPMLIKFREYFNANTGREVAALQITAAQAVARLAMIQAATSAIARARDELLTKKRARDLAQKALRKRLCGLRAELEQVLSDEDGAWLEFGLRRPADQRLPAPVEEVTVSAGGPGIAIVAWPPAERADSYRVSYQTLGSEAPPVGAGIVTGTQWTLMDLPAGAEIVVTVAARNRAGEARPAAAPAQLVSG